VEDGGDHAALKLVAAMFIKSGCDNSSSDMLVYSSGGCSSASCFDDRKGQVLVIQSIVRLAACISCTLRADPAAQCKGPRTLTPTSHHGNVLPHL
jgi:hypothetical protein